MGVLLGRSNLKASKYFSGFFQLDASHGAIDKFRPDKVVPGSTMKPDAIETAETGRQLELVDGVQRGYLQGDKERELSIKVCKLGIF